MRTRTLTLSTCFFIQRKIHTCSQANAELQCLGAQVRCLYSYGLCSYGVYALMYCLYSYGLHSYDLYSYGLYKLNDGLCSYGA